MQQVRQMALPGVVVSLEDLDNAVRVVLCNIVEAVKLQQGLTFRDVHLLTDIGSETCLTGVVRHPSWRAPWGVVTLPGPDLTVVMLQAPWKIDIGTNQVPKTLEVCFVDPDFRSVVVEYLGDLASKTNIPLHFLPPAPW